MNNYKFPKFNENNCMSRWILLLAVGLCVASLAGCDIYRVDVKQGQISAFENAETLEVGMTRVQVIEIMGTPLVIDPFRDNRWDYVYSEVPGNEGEIIKRRVTLIFDGEELIEVIIEGN